jgi:hypothetical protein
MCRNALLIGAVGQSADSGEESAAGGSEVEPSPPVSISPDEAFDLLANGRRRRVVERLCESDGELPLSEVAESLAGAETETAEEADGRYKSVYVSLQQTHLPKLQDAGVLVYDEDGRSVKAGPALPEIGTYVESDDATAEGAADRRVTAGVCAFGALLFGAKTVGVPGLGAIPSDPAALAVFLVALAAAVALDGAEIAPA